MLSSTQEGVVGPQVAEAGSAGAWQVSPATQLLRDKLRQHLLCTYKILAYRGSESATERRIYSLHFSREGHMYQAGPSGE
jgi:hypothetical protein